MKPADLFHKPEPITAAQVAEESYLAISNDMLAEALALEMQGFTHWAMEVRQFAAIADHAAWAERVNPHPHGLRP